jgi:Predicted hydrolases of the HAD superfamily
MAVAFDIDGTLAQGPFVPERIRELEPRPHVIRTLKGLSRAGMKIIVVTARPESYREDTEWWLRRHGIPYHTLRMRGSGDNRPDPALRAEQVADATFLFDDRADNCDQVAARCVRV